MATDCSPCCAGFVQRASLGLSTAQASLAQEDAGLRAARAEAELRFLQERLREEQAVCDALKKQMGEAGRQSRGTAQCSC